MRLVFMVDVLGEERKPVFSVENILFIILIPCYSFMCSTMRTMNVNSFAQEAV